MARIRELNFKLRISRLLVDNLNARRQLLELEQEIEEYFNEIRPNPVDNNFLENQIIPDNPNNRGNPDFLNEIQPNPVDQNQIIPDNPTQWAQVAPRSLPSRDFLVASRDFKVTT